MQLTDQEIRDIIMREKKRKKKRKRVIKRVSLLVLILAVIVAAVFFIVNRAKFVEPRGVIFLDAGHGGVDPGSSVGSRDEKDDTLKLTLKVRDELENLNFKVVLSRDDDTYVNRVERAKIANKNNAAFSISIHRNKAVEGNGVELYIPSKNDEVSQLLGNNIFNALASQGFYPRSVRVGTLQSTKDDYAENSETNMPSCLVEVGFMQDEKDNKLFDNNLESNALAIATAISDTFQTLYEPADIE